MKYCSTCGSKIPPSEAASAKFCSSCGNPFNKAFQPASVNKPKVRVGNRELEEDDEFDGVLPILNPADVIINVPEKMTISSIRQGNSPISR